MKKKENKSVKKTKKKEAKKAFEIALAKFNYLGITSLQQAMCEWEGLPTCNFSARGFSIVNDIDKNLKIVAEYFSVLPDTIDEDPSMPGIDEIYQR